MRVKAVPLYLSPDLYRRLEVAGRAEERDVEQQARWILRQALGGTEDGATERPAPPTGEGSGGTAA